MAIKIWHINKECNNAAYTGNVPGIQIYFDFDKFGPGSTVNVYLHCVPEGTFGGNSRGKVFVGGTWDNLDGQLVCQAQGPDGMSLNVSGSFVNTYSGLNLIQIVGEMAFAGHSAAGAIFHPHLIMTVVE